MTRQFVIDTNVPIYATVSGNESPDCQENCMQFLLDVMKSHQVAIDSHHHILSEYRKHLNDQGQPGVGDRFLKWLYVNRTSGRVREYDIEPLSEDPKAGYATCPPELDGFDPSDKKFVCVYLTAGADALKIAADSDWIIWGDQMAALGISIDHVCVVVHDR